MSLSENVLKLWNIRLCVLIEILFVISDHYTGSTLLSFSGAFIIQVVFFIYFIFRKRSFSLLLTADTITIRSGIFIRTTLNLKLKNIISVSSISTPLSSHLKLSNLILYCQGAFFILPPLENKSTARIIGAIKAEVLEYEK